MPKFYIIHPNYSDFKQEISAHDAQEAAETYARQFDGSNESVLASSFSSLEFDVESEDGTITKFSVTASIYVNYFATEI